MTDGPSRSYPSVWDWRRLEIDRFILSKERTRDSSVSLSRQDYKCPNGPSSSSEVLLLSQEKSSKGPNVIAHTKGRMG